jgi:hypothetical protein
MVLQLANFAVAHDRMPLVRAASLFVIQKKATSFFFGLWFADSLSPADLNSTVFPLRLVFLEHSDLFW